MANEEGSELIDELSEYVESDLNSSFTDHAVNTSLDDLSEYIDSELNTSLIEELPTYIASSDPISSPILQSATNHDDQEDDMTDPFAFHDNSPPPVRAPDCEEDWLYIEDERLEVSSNSSDSIFSSDIPSSGKSTESLPYGHMFYAEPEFSKRKSLGQHNGGLRTPNKTSILLKKLSKKSLTFALRPCKCIQNCSKRQFFTPSLVKSCRKNYWKRDVGERRDWLFDKFNDFQTPDSNIMIFSLAGYKVCRKAWIQAYGMDQSGFYKKKQEWTTKKLLSKKEKCMSTKRYQAAAWFSQYAASYGELSSFTKETWLPTGTRKKDVYQKYIEEMKRENQKYLSHQAFYNMWKEWYTNVIIKRANDFARCTICERFDRQLYKTLDPEKKNCISLKKEQHLRRQMIEKLAYYRRRDVARRRPDKFLSLIIDGMDQAKTQLPHIHGRQSKEFQATKRLKTHITGVINHGANRKETYIDILQYKHDSNLTLNILLKALWKHSKGNPLPPVLYLQADNCFRENKNKYIFSFLELLVWKNVFYEIQISFLNVGHTHEDVDQMFSVIADNLKGEDAFTLGQLSTFMPNCIEVRGLYNISGWLEPHLRRIQKHTKPSMFRFRKDLQNNDVLVYYRRNSQIKWKVLQGGFFKRHNNIPNLPTTVPSHLLPNFDKLELDDVFDNIQTWVKYCRNEGEITWWDMFISNLIKIKESTAKIKQYAKHEAVWHLKNMLPCNMQALESEAPHETAFLNDIQPLLDEEEQNPQVIVH